MSGILAIALLWGRISILDGASERRLKNGFRLWSGMEDLLLVIAFKIKPKRFSYFCGLNPVGMKKDIIIRRVADILKETPSAEDIVKKGGDRDKRFLYLARHMVNKAIAKEALITAGEGMGIAILFESGNEKEGYFKELFQEIGLVLHVTGVKNALKIVRNQKYIKSQRPADGNYLY